MSHTLLILKIYTTFKDVQMMLKRFFDICTGFRFSKISVECSVHLCSCPWHSTTTMGQISFRVCIWILTNLWFYVKTIFTTSKLLRLNFEKVSCKIIKVKILMRLHKGFKVNCETSISSGHIWQEKYKNLEFWSDGSNFRDLKRRPYIMTSTIHNRYMPTNLHCS